MIVDPQIDFISGSLTVPDAAEKIKNLADYVLAYSEKYKVIAVTEDWHPLNHCSFKENSGQWPVHCVQNTRGASIEPCLLSALNQSGGILEILHKGDKSEREEYSVFQNESSALRLDNLIHTHQIKQIDICGIAGDICVLSTLNDGIKRYGNSIFSVLTQFCPSLDGGVAITKAAIAIEKKSFVHP